MGAPSCMQNPMFFTAPVASPCNPSCWILSTARSAEKPQRWLRSKPGKLVDILHSALQSCVLVWNCVSLLCPDLQLSTIDMCKLPFATVYHHASCLQIFVIRHHIVSKVFIFNYLPSYAIICPCSFFKTCCDHKFPWQLFDRSSTIDFSHVPYMSHTCPRPIRVQWEFLLPQQFYNICKHTSQIFSCKLTQITIQLHFARDYPQMFPCQPINLP